MGRGSMTDSLTIFGTDFTGVTGIKATGTGNGTLTYIRPQGTKPISANGTGIDVTEYAAVDVAVPAPTPTLQTVTKSYTPTESAQSETVSAGTGYDGIDTVSISVGAISSTYVGSGITSRSSTDLSASGATVTAPAGYYASQATKSVASMTLPTAASSTSSGTSKATITPGSAAQYLNIPTGYNDTASYYTIAAGGSTVKTATGTFTGNGTRQIDVSCSFEPDIVYFNSDPGTSASSGTVAAIIVRGMMTATRYRNNSTTNTHYAIPAITGMNTAGSSYSWRSTYDSSTSKVTLYCWSSNARTFLTSNRTYSYTFVKYTQ